MIRAEERDAVHEARLLLLLHNSKDGSIDGITKLAKLDFLLRYPLYFKRLLSRMATGMGRVVEVPQSEFEENTVESAMIRYRYGPWDPRYRRWIGILVAQSLANTFVKGKTVYVALTPKGHEIAAFIAALPEFDTLKDRAEMVIKKVGNRNGTWLKKRIYEVVPELMGLPWGAKIKP